ncbi:FtsX-like permease family protein [Saccharopolyspora kobensis]|uniref:FtsX-like permease family protein n=1 Tax=Saccharopolyspora kobensis TaxID=146035 RepID=A0A1H6EGW0_9PSEU|nr:FtsX-like permease family protein [Saccharopolyspora kobensis]SEG96209.1 FtsX-like permease family protein [Saccharopolyspora kobensis]SFD21381.1 FtsX-like permease family protein [Saccharopolyspora kobensis]
MNPVQLALRVLRVDSRSRLSALLTAAGVAVATALVLFLATLPNATDARMERSAWQQGSVGEHGVTLTSRDFFQNQTITRLDVSGTADPANPAPNYPAPGEVLLSPRLADLAGKYPSHELADRFAGKVIGTLDENHLKFPEQLVAVVGHPPGTVDAEAAEISGFGAVDTSDFLLKFMSGVGIVLLAIPSMVLVASAARLTAARRERRLAALRLAGATPGQVIGVVTAETAVAAVVGTVVGLLLSWPLRYLGVVIPWGGGTWLLSDFTPSPITVVLIGLLIPTLVVVAAVLGLRRVVRAPLGAAMSHVPKRPKAWRLLALVAAGAFFLFGLWTAEETGGLGFLLAALAAVLLSASIVGPWLTGMLGSLFASMWRKPSMLLAGRRLRSDPKAAYRSVSGIVLAVFVGSMALTLLPSFETFAGGGRSFKDPVLYLDVPTAGAVEQEQRIKDQLASSGTAATVVRAENVILEDPDGNIAVGLVLSCQDAAAVTRFGVGDCAGPPAVWTAAGQPLPSAGLKVQSTPPSGVDDPQTQEIVLPDGVPVRQMGEQDPEVDGSVIIDPALVPAFTEHGETTLAVKPANEADREKVRTALATALPGERFNSRELRLYEQQTMLGDLKRITAIGLGLTALLAGASAAITAASSVVDRRRTFSALIAAGTPVRMLGRALRTEAALPAMVATIGAGVAGTAVAAGIFTLFGDYPVVISGWILAPVVIGMVVAVLASSSSGPMLRRISAERISDE